MLAIILCLEMRDFNSSKGEFIQCSLIISFTLYVRPGLASAKKLRRIM